MLGRRQPGADRAGLQGAQRELLRRPRSPSAASRRPRPISTRSASARSRARRRPGGEDLARRRRSASSRASSSTCASSRKAAARRTRGSSISNSKRSESRSGERTSSCPSRSERSRKETPMGGGQYSLDIARSFRSQNPNAFAQPASAAAREVHAALNPYGKRREVNNVTPIVVALDVTRSRGDDTKLMYEKLPQLMGQIELKGYIENPGISFAAIGDATVDRAPLQVGQFEGDNRLDQVLERILDRGGRRRHRPGELRARRVLLQPHELRAARQGHRQEGLLLLRRRRGLLSRKSTRPQIRASSATRSTADVPADEAFRRLQEKFHCFLLLPAEVDGGAQGQHRRRDQRSRAEGRRPATTASTSARRCCGTTATISTCTCRRRPASTSSTARSRPAAAAGSTST